LSCLYLYLLSCVNLAWPYPASFYVVLSCLAGGVLSPPRTQTRTGATTQTGKDNPFLTVIDGKVVRFPKGRNAFEAKVITTLLSLFCVVLPCSWLVVDLSLILWLSCFYLRSILPRFSLLLFLSSLVLSLVFSCVVLCSPV
jgi:hypothetical protein